MALTAKDDTITFSSGRTVYANCLLVGIRVVDDPDHNSTWGMSEFSEGYDGGFSVKTPGTRWSDFGIEVEDALELCDAMLEAWRNRREFLAALPSSAGEGR